MKRWNRFYISTQTKLTLASLAVRFTLLALRICVGVLWSGMGLNSDILGISLPTMSGEAPPAKQWHNRKVLGKTKTKLLFQDCSCLFLPPDGNITQAHNWSEPPQATRPMINAWEAYDWQGDTSLPLRLVAGGRCQPRPRPWGRNSTSQRPLCFQPRGLKIYRQAYMAVLVCSAWVRLPGWRPWVCSWRRETETGRDVKTQRTLGAVTVLSCLCSK